MVWLLAMQVKGYYIEFRAERKNITSTAKYHKLIVNPKDVGAPMKLETVVRFP